MYGSARTVGTMEESPSRSPRLPRSPRLGHRRTPGRGGGTGKTLSMENIQSLNAAYATSGPMYLSDHEAVGSTTYPKGTMTLGRATSRATYGGRVTAMGSSPNIASAGLPHGDMLSYGDHGGMPPHSHQVPSGLRQLRDNAMLDLQSQMKDLQRENDLLRRELDVKDSKLGSSMNSIKTFWSPELKKERVMRKEEIARTSVLKEQMRVTHEENQVDALRLRLEEKESFLNKKSKQLQDLTEEKGTLAGEIRDMKDMLEVKERKVNVLQKKIENLQEQLRDKDKQLTNLKDRVKSLQTDSSNTDTALATLEEALSEKEKIIERLKEQREREDRERLEEVESYKKENKDLKEKVNTLQAELTDKESSLIDLKEHASSLASSGLKKDSKLKSLEIAIEQKMEECSKLETQLQKAHETEEAARTNTEILEKMKHLEKEVVYYKEESSKSQAEVDRLLEILREVETEKNNRDKKIAEMESLASRQTKDQNKQTGSPRHPQMEKKKEEGMTDNTPQQIEELLTTLEQTRQELDATKQRLSSTQQSLVERDTHLTNLRQERRKQLEEILEMKQQALLAAISEKDANIALLELSASKKKKTQEEVMALRREKDRLMHQLKQQTQSRMKLIADNYEDDHHHALHPQHHPHAQHPPHPHHRGPVRGPPHENHRPSPDQMMQSQLEQTAMAQC
uniref:ELKS/RAB6-interacting/CAST family member 2 n=1 Tax=Paramormyrops kingsleyae TaxID=1676925 RepID=A0A3B3R3K6_9TELE